MSKKEIEFIEIELDLDLSKEDKSEFKIPETARVKLEQIIDEKKTESQIERARMDKLRQKESGLNKVYELLEGSYLRAREFKSEPEPITGATLLKTYGEEMSLSPFILKLKHYMRKEKGNKYCLTKKTRKGQSAYFFLLYDQS